jgi:hypothetical protein
MSDREILLPLSPHVGSYLDQGWQSHYCCGRCGRVGVSAAIGYSQRDCEGSSRAVSVGRLDARAGGVVSKVPRVG